MKIKNKRSPLFPGWRSPTGLILARTKGNIFIGG